MRRGHFRRCQSTWGIIVCGGDCHTSNRDPLGQLALLSTNSNKPLSDTFLLPSSIFGKKLLHELVVGRKTTPCGTKVMFRKRHQNLIFRTYVRQWVCSIVQFTPFCCKLHLGSAQRRLMKIEYQNKLIRIEILYFWKALKILRKCFIKNPINVLGGILLERFYPLLDSHLCTCLGYLQQIPF